MKVLGVDPSTKTGLALVSNSGECVYHAELVYPKLTGLERALRISEEFELVLATQCPDLVVIEGFAYGNTGTLALLVEIASLLKYRVVEQDIPLLIVPPTKLKKFVCGKGNAKKDMVRLDVFKRWAFEHPSDNVIDAYALAMYGFYHTEEEKFTRT